VLNHSPGRELGQPGTWLLKSFLIYPNGQWYHRPVRLSPRVALVFEPSRSADDRPVKLSSVMTPHTPRM
jgi:hypothetical protein